MKFGHFCLPTFFADVDGDVGVLMRRWLDLLAESEELGFDSLWANEHHYDAYGGIVPSTSNMLAALSQRTRKARLGTSVVVLPMHNPIEIAEQFAMVDLMSGGRVEFGIGRGFVGGSQDELQLRMQEQLEVILKAWSGEPVSHQGRLYKYEGLTVWPRPQQRPHPPIWISCSETPSSFEWTGRMGYDLLTVTYRGVSWLFDNNKLYRDAWQAAGHAPGRWRITAHYHCVLAESRQEAREIAREAWIRYLGVTRDPKKPELQQAMRDIDRMVDEMRILACTPDEAVNVLQRAHDAMGFTECTCTFFFGGITFEQAQRSLRLFAREVIPRLKDREPHVVA